MPEAWQLKTFARRATSGKLNCVADMCAASDEATIFAVLQDARRDAV
jgi:hypothetical protein